MKKQDLLLEIEKLKNKAREREALLKEAAGYIRTLENQNTIANALQESAGAYIMYLLDLYQQTLDQEGQDFIINKEDLTRTLQEFELKWYESEDQTQIVMKIAAKELPELEEVAAAAEEGGVTIGINTMEGEDTPNAQDEEELTTDQVEVGEGETDPLH